MTAGAGVAIVDYGMGNLGSIANMIKKAGGSATITSDPDAIANAARIILPGVGAFDAGMKALEDRALIPLLNRKALEEHVPVLGICLGVQLMTREGQEGTRKGLGWLDAETRRFDFSSTAGSLKLPHMGWNEATVHRNNPLLAEKPDEPWRFYFVHEYHLAGCNEADILCSTTYGYPFTSGVMKGNIFGVQFHPEKSHAFGMNLISHFLGI